MSSLSTLPKGDSAWLLRKAIERIMEQVSVLETNIGSSTTGNSANTQIIFNDNGTLRGDAGLVYNKTTDALTVAGLVTAGSATITGAATVGTTLGVTGVSTLASAVVTGALTSGTTTLVSHAAGYTGKVGIGTATPVDKVQITSALASTGTGIVSANGLTFQNTDTTVNNYTAIQNRDSSGSQNAQIQFVNVTQGTTFEGAIAFTTRASAGDYAERARFNPTGNLAFASGKGIDFSAVTGGTGTATANVLNDYEEGTWTPVVADAASGGNVGTCTISSATYTKIGRQVSVEFYILAIGTAGMTAVNSLTIRGFPFSATIQAQGSFYTYRVGRNAATVSSSAFVVAGNSYVQFFCFGTNSATTDIRILVSDIVSGTSELRMSVTYFV